MSEQNCLNFYDFFPTETKSVNTRNMDLERLVVSAARKRTTAKSSFFRVQRVVIDTADLLSVGISSFKSKNRCQNLIHRCLLNLTKTKYDINNVCTWALKRRCSFEQERQYFNVLVHFFKLLTLFSFDMKTMLTLFNAVIYNQR